MEEPIFIERLTDEKKKKEVIEREKARLTKLISGIEANPELAEMKEIEIIRYKDDEYSIGRYGDENNFSIEVNPNYRGNYRGIRYEINNRITTEIKEDDEFKTQWDELPEDDIYYTEVAYNQGLTIAENIMQYRHPDEDKIPTIKEYMQRRKEVLKRMLYDLSQLGLELTPAEKEFVAEGEKKYEEEDLSSLRQKKSALEAALEKINGLLKPKKREER